MAKQISRKIKIPDYKLKTINEDFEVIEVPLLPSFHKVGQYTYLWIKKSGFSTFDAQDKLKNFFKLNNEDIGVEGLKDEDGVTSQIVSLKKVLKEVQVKRFNLEHSFESSFITIEYIMGYGDSPVAEKMLHANQFNLVLRNLTNETSDAIINFCNNNKFVSFINYYDSQRFGLPGGPYNTHLIGKAIVDQNWKEAYKQFKISGNTGLPEDVVVNAKSTQEDYKKIFLSINPKKLNFFLSSYDSHLWNTVVSRKLAKSCIGKDFEFKNVGKLFIPKGNVFNVENIISCNGHRLDKDLKVSGKDNTRCALTTTAVYVLDVKEDELHKGRKKLKLSFLLPTGSYATMCIRQLIYKSLE